MRESPAPRRRTRSPESSEPARPRARSTTTPADAARPRSIKSLREVARGCRNCPLWRIGTQTVFGEGPQKARVMLVGEQPGDQEDLQGRPFVGPAGKMLDRALAELGIDRDALYLTNVVKHFKHTLRGTRRLHQRPNAAEQAACRMWLEAELLAVKPERVVCLGATAARAFLGRKFRLTVDHGKWVPDASGAQVMATIHPSALLRMPDRDARAKAYAEFVEDLRTLLD